MLIEPVAIADFFLSFFTGAAIILTAALYAILFAWAELSQKKSLHYWSWLAFASLLISVVIFSKINHLNGHWSWLPIIMVFGYWWLPRFIYKLCAATHHE